MRRIVLFTALVASFPVVLTAAEVNWPMFRGGPVAGVAEDKKLPDTWDADKNVAWKIDLPGRGWSCPIVWGDKIFLTSVINEGKSEDPKKGLYFGGDRLKPSPDVHHWMTYCIDWKTGKVLWEKEAAKAVPENSLHIKNSYASETPVTDGERVYAYFGNRGLFCYDMNGKELWSQKWPVVKTRMGWGTAASPVLHKDRLYVINDNEEKSYLLALDKMTGKEIWRIDRDERSNWATPFIWENEMRTELVTAGTNRVRSYDLDGKLLWELSGMSSITIPTPFARHGLLYVCSGYVGDFTRRPVFAIRPGASGDISLGKDETSNKHIAWCQKLAGPYNPTPIVYGDYLYVLYDLGALACYEAKTGKEVYARQRLAAGRGGFTASPWASDGKIYCLSEDGECYVVKAGPEFKVLGKNSLDDMCMATPATVRGNIVLRTLTKLYRIEEKGP